MIHIISDYYDYKIFNIELSIMKVLFKCSYEVMTSIEYNIIWQNENSTSSVHSNRM